MLVQNSIIINTIALLASLTVLAQGPVPEGEAPGKEATAVVQHLRDTRAELGLGEEADFQVQDDMADELGFRHVRVQQTHRGLRVWGAQAIAHLGPSGMTLTDALVRNVQVEITPNLAPQEALAVAKARIAPMGSFTDDPAMELVVWPQALQEAPESGDEPSGPAASRCLLAYHLHTELENGRDETRHEDLLVDAHTGAVLKMWSTLLTVRRRVLAPTTGGTPAKGTGLSRHFGKVKLAVVNTGHGFELRDPTRGNFSTRNLRGGIAGMGVPYRTTVPQWGDGTAYDAGLGPASVSAQTDAVDAHYGLEKTWDFLLNVLGRRGIDGNGRAPVNRMHYARGYANAFWADECFCMTYGDGMESGVLTAIDVVGHEVAHGICHATAGLGYDGEAGSLNEANSDIFGMMLRFYVRGSDGTGKTIPEAGAPWNLGDAEGQAPIRCMDKPSEDGESPDAWSPGLRHLDVHNGSGPMNRAFFFLAQGASPTPHSRSYSPRLPRGMTGLGNDKAFRIWWRTLSTRLTPTSTYRQAYRGALQAARELYGRGGREEQAVANAFRGINVGVRTR